MSTSPESRLALRVAAIYVGVGVLWILFSDRLLATLVADPLRLTELQTLKGWLWVGGSGALIFILMRSGLRSLARSKLHVRATEERFREFAQQVPQVFWITSVDRREVEFLNSAYETIWGRPREEVFDDPEKWLEAVHPDDRPRLVEVLRSETEGGYDEEFRVVRPDGETRWVRARTFPIRTEDGRIHRLAGVTEDVTERKHREEDLLLLESAIRQAGEGVLITDSEGIIQYVNPAFEKVTGYPRDEAVGRTPRILKSGRYEREYYRRMWATLLDGEAIQGRIVNRRKNGELYTQDSVITPVRSGGGEITHMVAVLRDVTHEIALEEQLRQAQKMEAIGRLAGGIAHDFNNVLTAIKGYARFALEELEGGSPARADVDGVLEAAERARNLTRQLLAFSRQQVVEPRVVEMEEVIREAEDMLRRLIDADVEVQMELSPDLGRVEVDPTQVDQVLVNLAVNARDAMPDGGRLTIQAENVDLAEDLPQDTSEPFRPGRYVRIRVTDTGTGMDEETRGRVFDPFFTTKPKGRGTGLGLSTVYGIVKQSGGYIRLESEPGRGTRFEIYLPRTDAPAEARKRKPESRPRDLTGSETVLVVEDQPDVLSVVRRTLERSGYRVHTAEHGTDALAVWEREGAEVDLVLTDMVMPRMGGRELARRLHDQGEEPPILFMSGYDQEEVAEDGEPTPGAVVLEKPFEAEELLRKVRRVLDEG